MIFQPRSPRQNARRCVVTTAIACCAIAIASAILVVDVVAALAATATAPARHKIAVLGATGNLGRQTIRECLDQDIPVRCLVRSSSVEKLPEEFTNSPLFEMVTGDLLEAISSSSSQSSNSQGSSSSIFRDDTVAPSAELLACLEGCEGVVACYGATRRTKLSDLFRNPEDIDPIHAKQINYRSMIALVAACKRINQNANSNIDNNDSNKINNNNKIKIKHIVRITGKGEDPNGFFSILLNGLGAYCKAWNYQGEVVLRTSLAEDDDDDSIGYTIVRPGILKKEEEDESNSKTKTTTKEPPPPLYTKDELELADNGGNDLKVTSVGYSQIASLLVELVRSAIGSSTQNHRVTLAAMNPSDDGESTKKKSSLAEKIAALQNDRCVVLRCVAACLRRLHLFCVLCCVRFVCSFLNCNLDCGWRILSLTLLSFLFVFVSVWHCCYLPPCLFRSLARTCFCFWFLFELPVRREFPTSLVAEHKAAVKAFFTKVAAVLSIVAIALATLVSRIFF